MSASQNQITGGAFQDIAGNPLANGYLLFVLSQDTQVNTQEVSSGITIKVPLDSSGNVQTDPAVSVWPNDVLSPANTFYNVSAYTAEGQLVWGPNAQQVLSTPSPYDIGAWIPGSVNVLNPGGNITGLLEEGTNVTITGDGTGTSPYQISATGGSGGVTEFNTRTGAVTLESSDVTGALTYTPVNKAGDTMTGLLVLSADPTANLGAATKQYVDSSSGTAITSLTGDVTATGPGSSAASVVKVNGGSVPASHAYVGTNSSSQVIAATTPLLPANNLSDVASESTSRTNLGLGTMATENASAVAITGGTVNGTTIGATTASTSTFTTGTYTGTLTLAGTSSTTGPLNFSGARTLNSCLYPFTVNDSTGTPRLLLGISDDTNIDTILNLTSGASSKFRFVKSANPSSTIASIDSSGNFVATGTVTATELATTQTPTASTTASDHSIPILVNGTTMYLRLSSTP